MATEWLTHAAGSIGRIGSSVPGEKNSKKVHTEVYKSKNSSSLNVMQLLVLTTRESEVALRRRVPTFSHCENNGPAKKGNNK